jgi:hypothetical protein
MLHTYSQFINENMKSYEALANEILQFLDKYARISPNFDAQYDTEDEKYTSPDASMLKYAANMLLMGKKPTDYIHSEWGSGGYGAYTDKIGKKIHDDILIKIKNI